VVAVHLQLNQEHRLPAGVFSSGCDARPIVRHLYNAE